jgi:magnesium chelatase family protein
VNVRSNPIIAKESNEISSMEQNALDSVGSPGTLVLSAQADAQSASLIRIECGLLRGFSGMQIIGNASETCKDGKERARSALEALGIRLPQQRLMISFIPADLKKDGSQFDLAIAVSLAVLIQGGEKVIDTSKWVFVAELGINGQLRPVRGIIAHALAAIQYGADGIIVAEGNLRDVSRLIGVTAGLDSRGLEVMSFSHLSEVLEWIFTGVHGGRKQDESVNQPKEHEEKTPNFDDMVLNPRLKTAVLAATVGMHSMLLRGSPGTGKSMLAARIPSILPPLSPADHVTAMRIHSSCSERLPPGLFAARPPVRSPHHQASAASVLGSGDYPGEISLAHGGVLFLDELPEFRRDLLEALREPLETGEVRVTRAKNRTTWNARVMLVAACNNCPCGWGGSPRKKCLCHESKVLAYRQRLSGPILDRIDIHFNMPEDMESAAHIFLELEHAPSESVTGQMFELVAKARAFGLARNRNFSAEYNRDLKASDMIKASGLESGDFSTLVSSVVPVQASSRSVLRSLRVARSIADLRLDPKIGKSDLQLSWSWQADPAARARGEHFR